MKKLKFVSLMIVLLFGILMFSSCSSFPYDNQTIIAKVTAIDGQNVTFLVGDMSIDENQRRGEGGDMGNMMPPNGNGSAPSMPDGTRQEMPSLPNGETMPEDGFASEGGMPMPDGEIPNGSGENMTIPFTAGDDTITLTLNEETVKTLSVGSIVQITFGDNGTVESLTAPGGDRQNGFGGAERVPPAIEKGDGSSGEQTSGEDAEGESV